MDMIETISMIFFLYCNRTIIRGMSPGFPTGVWLVCLCIFLLFSSGKGNITLQNHCQFSISIFWYGEPSPVLQPDQPNPVDLKPTNVASFSVLPSGGSQTNFYACNSVDKDCNAGHDSATVAVISMGNETNSYQVSAQGGYNLPLGIKAPGLSKCSTITCTANLTDCPADLQSYSNGNIIACKLPEDCGKSRVCWNYWKKLEGSDCFKEQASRCDAGVDLVITFCPT